MIAELYIHEIANLDLKRVGMITHDCVDIESFIAAIFDCSTAMTESDLWNSHAWSILSVDLSFRDT